MVRGGFDSEVSFCFPGSPKFEQRGVHPSAKCDSYGFEFQTCQRFGQDEAIVQENRKAVDIFSGRRPMAYADDLFLNGKILPLKLKLPPCKQGSRGMGTRTPVCSPSPSPRSPLSPGAFFCFRDKRERKDDMVTDPFKVALENVKSDKNSMELNVDFGFDPFELTRSDQCRMFEPRGVAFARKLRLAQLKEELKEMRTEAVSHFPKRRRIRNFLKRCKRSVLGKLRIGGSSGSIVNAAPVDKARWLAVVKYKPNEILFCLGYGGMSIRYS